MKNRSKNTYIQKPKATRSLIMVNCNLSRQLYTREISKWPTSNRWESQLRHPVMILLVLCHQGIMFIILHLAAMFTGQVSKCLKASTLRCMNALCDNTKAAPITLHKHIILSFSQETLIPRKAFSKRKVAKAVYMDINIQLFQGWVMEVE